MVLPVVGESASPTRYHVRLKPDTDAYVCCGADIILTGFYGDVDGEARCPVCEGSVTLAIRGQKIISLEPKTALLHYVECSPGPGRFEVECEYTHLFDDEDCLRLWLRDHSGLGGRVATPQDFLKMFASLLG